MNEDKIIEEEAVRYVKVNKRQIVEDVIGNVLPVEKAVAIFMAGSPGAGKTEFSKRFLEDNRFGLNTIVRIDPDEIRESLPGYNGENAYLFQAAVAIAIEKVLDYVFKKNIHFLLDGTLAHKQVATKNIRRALKHSRIVLINYVYQPKIVAWEFTQEREKVVNRKITKEVFANGFKNAKLVVADIKKEFKKKVRVDLITRNIKTNKYKHYFNKGVDEIMNIDKRDGLL